MTALSQASTRFRKLKRFVATAWNQVSTLFRNLKWIIAISLAISVGLYLPDQVRELYRISAGQGGMTLLKQFVAIAGIATVIWFGAFQITSASIAERIAKHSGELGPRTGLVFGIMPILIGVLPILAAAAGHYQAIPGRLSAQETDKLIEVGNVYRVHHEALKQDSDLLMTCAVLLLVMAVVFWVLTWRYGEHARTVSHTANRRYFNSFLYFLVSVGMIAALVAAFVLFPAAFAQWLGTLVIVALFTVCLVLMGVHVTLKTMDHRFPYFPALLALAFLWAWIGWNDNHHIRLVDSKLADATTGTETAKTNARMSAADAFEAWVEQPGRLDDKRKDEFPVFIVSAQGGGIYAAHNAATFLARMQDLCPSFRRHLFAISGVSGGAVGASIFAAALHATDQQSPAPHKDDVEEACPKIAQFLARVSPVSGMYETGQIEGKTELALSDDFLSPLVGATLFPDFTQRFLPFAIPQFDRARALEYALESAGDRMVPDGSRAKTGSKIENLLRSDYSRHWTPSNNMPALLLNTTDAGSGKRVLISPFDFDPHHPVDSDLCMLARVVRSPAKDGKREVKESRSLSFSLSTAAFMSARFPWITPAATVRTKRVDAEAVAAAPEVAQPAGKPSKNTFNECITKEEAARFVDGGYVDNSGVETALALIDRLDATKSVKQRRVRIYLLSLSGGDFPDRRAFSFNEVMEPVRALLSVRSSRAYIALNRAEERAKAEASAQLSAEAPKFSFFNKNMLRDHFYDLPLGWSLSGKTRQIISLGSGRFWDCEPSDKFFQTREHMSNADCLLIQAYHLMNGSTAEALEIVRELEVARAKLPPAEDSTKFPKLDHQKLLACYESNWVQKREMARYDLRRIEAGTKAGQPVTAVTLPALPPYRKSYLAHFQTERAKALLNEWERFSENDPRILAYLLGAVSYDTGDFVRMTERLAFRREEAVFKAWQRRIALERQRLDRERNGAPEIRDMIRNPRTMANIVYGHEGNWFENKQYNDGWNYRPRGLYHIIGREQFSETNEALKNLYPNLNVDILKDPETLWHHQMSAKVVFAHFNNKRYGKNGEDGTLVEMLTKRNLKYEDVRAKQKDMQHGEEDQKAVAERASMFHECIDRALLQSASSSFLFEQFRKNAERATAIAFRLAGFDYSGGQ